MKRTKVPKPKYIAEGFHEDVGELLNEFIEKGTTEFAEFADVWKKHHFALVFMGRPDHIENTEFTNEAFKISCHFLLSASFYEKVGAVYLLYALFRNQISVPPIRIRLEINQYRIIKTLHIEAKLKNYMSLHYVIDYLMKNALVFVAHQMLRGPLTGVQNLSKNYDAISNIKSSYKSDIMEYSVSNNLKALQDLHAQYLAEKRNFSNDVKISLNNASDAYNFFIHDLKAIVEPPTSKHKKESLGNRRAKIKAQSFIRKTQNRFGQDEKDDDDDDEDDPDYSKIEDKNRTPKKKRPARVKRLPPHERRVGRPSKKKPKPQEVVEEQSEDEIDFSHLLSQQQDFYLPPTETEWKKNRSRRDPYYKVSPKREEESSDPDDPTVNI